MHSEYKICIVRSHEHIEFDGEKNNLENTENLKQVTCQFKKRGYFKVP